MDYDPEALKRYRESPEQLPPIRVDRESRVLLDGFHRVKVFQELGKTEIPVVFEDCPPEKYLARALELNLHGSPIPPSQRDLIIQRLAEQGLSHQEIAKAAGLSQPRVSQILASKNRDTVDKDSLFGAIRLVEAGRSFREAEKMSGVPKSTLERALREAKDRQELIRKHLQSRGSLTSLLRYPGRGPWGKGSYFGNCNGYLLVDLIDYFKPNSVFDPMEGSGTTREVCFDLKVDYEGRDIHSGFDLLSSPLPNRQFDLIFWHPPYWPGFLYSQHPNDFSRADNWLDYLERMRAGFNQLMTLLSPNGHLVILIGDGRKNGTFFPIHSEIIHWGLLPLEAVLIKEGVHERRAKHFRYGPTAFIPTLHEYVLIFKRGSR
jgi:predicted transcriptional regulator